MGKGGEGESGGKGEYASLHGLGGDVPASGLYVFEPHLSVFIYYKNRTVSTAT